MKHTFGTLALTIALSAAAGSTIAQDFTFHWNPRSGDVWVDTWLQDINRYGYRYRDPFIDEMVRYYDVPRDLVHDLVVGQRWAPGDVYYACAIAQIIGRPCRYVVDQWRRDHGQGWGAMAQRLGIKPGSAEFHRLKRGFVPTYDRWARPIVIDADLRSDFPNRGKAAKSVVAGNDKSGKPAHAQSHGNSDGKGNQGSKDDKGGNSDKGGNNGKGEKGGKGDKGNKGGKGGKS